MIVTLAGYNVEADLIKNIVDVNNDILTPEIFSSAYARISRSSKDVTALRLKARKDVENARKSNKQIIFDMGHHSVAEHAVFNFDIIGVSRLALEEIEQFRLSSYTEKSQRYVTLKGDYVVPTEFNNKEQQHFEEIVSLQNNFYKKSYTVLKDYIFNKFSQLAEKKSNHSLLQGWAKEDARYILSLATEGQVGMTINARNLEHLFRRFHLSRRTEVKEIGRRMYEQVKKVAPSIILFSEPSDFSKELQETFNENFKKSIFKKKGTEFFQKLSCADRVSILHYTKNGDDIILASFCAIFNGIDYKEALDIITHMARNEKEVIFKDLFKNIEFFDSMPRQFEMVDITFQAIISASNFAQLKRHRLATLLVGSYDINFGNIVPENLKKTGLDKEFLEIIEKTNEVYLSLKRTHGEVAEYILTNSHCRMVIMKMNLRELFHFMRLRDDEHAQWDIRLLAHRLLEQVKDLMPLSTMLLCGKSDFFGKFETIFNRKPKVIL